MRDKILAMEAGRELDALVAENIMGIEVIKKRRKFEWVHIPHYSTELSEVFKVIEKMALNGWMMYKLSHTLSGQSKVDGFICVFLNIQSGAGSEYTADTASEAICKAALLSVIES